MRNIRKQVYELWPSYQNWEMRYREKQCFTSPQQARKKLTKSVTLDRAVTTKTLETFVSVPGTQHSGFIHFGGPRKNKWLSRAW